MNYEEFLEYMKEHLKEVLEEGDEGQKYDIHIHKIVKNNGIVLDGLVIRKEAEPVSPNIYLNPYFESYQLGKPIAVIMEEIVLRYQRVCDENEIDVIDITDFNNVKDKIVLRLVNYEKNKEMLKLCPNRRYLDLAITFRYMVSKDSLGIASSLVSKAEFELWRVDLEELYRLALFNTMREFPWKMESLVKVVTESIRGQDMGVMPEDIIRELEQMENGVNMYVLTNEYGINGATCILYDNVIRNFAKVQDCNIFVLPSSVHEVMLVPENAETEPEFLEELVMEANKSAVGLIDLLSDHIYYYDREYEQMYIYQQN
ncbi:MAG: hypothetical protein K2L07_08530 [Lachnospiraceae bacterium]|nr:hypothetical protein [Lachnospiraceae bacterium]